MAPGALIVGGDFQGLGVARSLGAHGIPVCVLDDERSIARYSRFVGRAVRAPHLGCDSAAVASMLAVGRRFGLDGWVLFPTRDETVAACSRHRDVLGEVFRVPTPPWSTIEPVWDKRRTYALAGELGIPVPRTWTPAGTEDLSALEAELPLAIKPAIKSHFIYATGVKAWRVDSPHALRQRFARATALLPAQETMVQELIPGDGSHQFAYCAFFKDGEAVARMVVNRRRQHPAEFGRASTYVRTVEMPVLEALSERFLRAIDYYGLVELEYKLDPRDGEPKLLDVNARTWGYHSIGARAGVDFAALLHADATGGEVQPCRAAPGVSWVRLLTDLPTGALEVLRGQTGARDYLRSVLSADVESVFSARDPLPALAELALVPYLLRVRGPTLREAG